MYKQAVIPDLTRFLRTEVPVQDPTVAPHTPDANSSSVPVASNPPGFENAGTFRRSHISVAITAQAEQQPSARSLFGEKVLA